MNVFSPRTLANISVVGPYQLRFTYTNNSYSTHNVIVWSIERYADVNGNPSIEGSVHFTQDGAIQGLGVLGILFNAESNLTLDGVLATSIDDIKNYLKDNL